VLFRLHPLPEKLKDRALQEELRAQVNGMVAGSHYVHRQLLLSAGQPAEHAYFVVEGFARGYYYDEQTGREITLFLWGESAVALAANSFFLRQPSDIYMEVMPGSALLSLSHGQLARIYELFPATEALAHLLTLQYNAFHKQRTKDLLTRSAWERYLDLLQAHPRIEQKVSKEVIASYLGVTPQSLSRLLRENGHP